MKTRFFIFLVVIVLLLVGLFFFLKPKSVAEVPVQNQNIATTNKIFTLVIKNRKIVSGSDNLKATEGDTVTMKITVDEAEEVHLHGYNKMIELQKDVEGTLTFTANLTGRFPFELENSKTDLGVLEVRPKE